ncbi:MAG: hypothetical protein ACRDT4_10870 [Micromonosporaceae bacterium]
MNDDVTDDRLARRYRTLLRAYPKSYRERRGEEILGTLLDTAGPGQSRPSLADATDLIAAGVRQRLAVDAVPSLHRGLLLAAPLALGLAAGLSLFFWLGTELAPFRPLAEQRVGPFMTLAPVAYVAWLLAVLAPLAVPRFGRRPWIGLALVATLAVPLVALLSPYGAPPGYVTALLAGLGLVALAGDVAPARQGAAVAGGMLAVAGLGFGIAWAQGYGLRELSRIGYDNGQLRAAAVLALLGLLTVTGFGIAQVVRRRDTSWLWAAAVLLLPVGWLAAQSTPFASNLTTAPAYLALSVAVVAAAVWLARQSETAPAGVIRPGTVIAATGATALGCTAALAAFVLVGDRLSQFESNGWSLGNTLWLHVGWLVVALAVPLIPVPRIRLAVLGLAVVATLGTYLLPRFTYFDGVPATALVVFTMLGVAALAATRLPVRALLGRTAGTAAGMLAAVAGFGYWLGWFQPYARVLPQSAMPVTTRRLLVGVTPEPGPSYGDRIPRSVPVEDGGILVHRVGFDFGGLAPEVVQAAALIVAVPLVFAAVILVRALLDRLYRMPDPTR